MLGGMEERRIGELATRLDPIPGGWTCEDVHRLFRTEPDLVSLAVQVDGRAQLINRSRFHELMVGCLGYGWALYGQQSIRRLLRTAGGAPRFDHDRTLVSAGLALLGSPEARAGDDVLVDLLDGGVGAVPTGAVFAELRRVFATQTERLADLRTPNGATIELDQPNSAVT